MSGRFTLLCLLLLISARYTQSVPPKAKKNPLTGKDLDEGKEKDYQSVVITGASSGIGYATALEFARNSKFKVYATMRTPEKWEAPPEEGGTSWSNLIVRQMDVTSGDSVKNAISQIVEEEGGEIDILVNNAGYGLAACLEGATIEEAKALFDVNVWGFVRATQEVLPYMRKKKDGHIINVSSTSGIRGIPGMEYYAGSKFAMEGIADSLRFSLAAFNISVTQINAGPVRTKFTDVYGSVEKGGYGTREIPGDADDGHYLAGFTQLMVDTLSQRMKSGEAQDQESVARVIVNVAHMKKDARKLVEVPFNIGTNQASQGVIEAVRSNPTGWTGMYAKLLAMVPPLKKKEERRAKDGEL